VDQSSNDEIRMTNQTRMTNVQMTKRRMHAARFTPADACQFNPIHKPGVAENGIRGITPVGFTLHSFVRVPSA
jgi:hypothetical protein